jgi:hypothetical protein
MGPSIEENDLLALLRALHISPAVLGATIKVTRCVVDDDSVVESDESAVSFVTAEEAPPFHAFVEIMSRPMCFQRCIPFNEQPNVADQANPGIAVDEQPVESHRSKSQRTI